MSVTEFQRHQVFQWLEANMGPEKAAVMMDLLPPVGWGDVATNGDLAVLRSEVRAEIAGVRTEVAELRGEMHEQLGHMTRTIVLSVLAANTALATAVLAALQV